MQVRRGAAAPKLADFYRISTDPTEDTAVRTVVDAQNGQQPGPGPHASGPSTYVVVVGQNSAGKSTVARVLSSTLALPLLEFGDLVRQELAKEPALGSDPSAAYIALRRERGVGLLAEWAEECDQRAHGRGLVMAGVRDIDSFRLLERRFSPMHVVAVVASPQARFDRDCAKSRQRGQPPLSAHEFADRDGLHASWGLPVIVPKARWCIANEADEDELTAKAIHVASRISLGHG